MEQIPDCFYRISAKALILDDDKRFLLVKEDNGFRELPGGGLDFGEDPQGGIKRELMEEMGIHTNKILDKPAYFVTTENLKGFRIANILYETLVNIEDILMFTPSKECQNIKFFTGDEVITEDLLPNVKKFIEQYNPKNH